MRNPGAESVIIQTVSKKFEVAQVRHAAVVAAVAVAVAAGSLFAGSEPDGRIGPGNHIQPSGRKLDPVGRTARLGNLPTGAALTRGDGYAWTLSAGRGANDIRIVRVRARTHRCHGDPNCKRRARRQVGKVIQTIKMPGLSGGIAMDPTRNLAYVSGTPATGHSDGAVGPGVPGQNGDVIHVLSYNRSTGKAKRRRLIDLPPPSGTMPPQNFPPTTTTPLSWPRDLAVSPDGTKLLAALNLANSAAIVDLQTDAVSYVSVGRYPYGAAISTDGSLGFVSNETPGTVSVIDLASGSVNATITVGPHLSHPEGIAIDPRKPRAYVAVTNQDLIAVINTETLTVERTLSVERRKGIGTSPVALSVTSDGCRLLSADSGEDAIAVFAVRTAPSCQARGHKRSKVKQWQLLGRIPVGSYPTAALSTAQKPGRRRLVWVAAKGLGAGRNDARGRILEEDLGSATGGAPAEFRFDYLPSNTFGLSGVMRFPGSRRLAKLTPRAAKQLRPLNREKPPADTPLSANGPIDHVFYIVRENRSYDQVLGDDRRGDGDPKLTLFGKSVTPNIHALARRFPLLDHVYANSEASIDGHFWTSAGAVSDYVVKSWHANYAGRQRPYDFGVYSVTWPSQRFLFDQAEKQGIPYFNYGEAVAGTIPLNDLDRNPAETAEVVAKFSNSDVGPVTPGPQPLPPSPCYSNDASIGKNVITMQDTWDSSLPPGISPATNESRFECFRGRFEQQLAAGSVPAFNYLVLPNDHTEGTTPGRRTPTAMIAENDWAVGQVVDEISHSSIWDSSLILVVEDDSQDGADHVDAHRIPALAISPWTRRGAVVHNRYDFLSFIRTMEIPIGMDPLNLFDANAVPLYDAFDSDPSDNDAPYNAIVPSIDITARNTASAANAKLSASLPLNLPDRVPQRTLDLILWQYVHGLGSTPPPPGPNAAGIDRDELEAEAEELERGIAEYRRQMIAIYREAYGRDAVAGAIGTGSNR